MRTIKLYEAFGQKRIAFTDKIGARGVQVDLYQEPDEIKYASVIGGVVNWDLDLITLKNGMSLGETPASITSIRLDYEVEDSEGDLVEKEIEIGEGEFSYEQFTSEINSFPLVIESIEISMNHSMDHKLWKISLYIGKKEN